MCDAGKVTHFHQWNDTNGSNAQDKYSTDGCVGKYGCNGGLFRIVCFFASAAISRKHIIPWFLRTFFAIELPTTSISLENGTTITIPILPGTQIDVATGTINTAHDAQNDAEFMDDVEEEDSDESEIQNNMKPFGGLNEQVALKPNTPQNHHPFANQFVQYPNFAFNPNALQLPHGSQFSQPPNFPQSHHYPHSPQFQQSVGPLGPPQNFFQQPFKLPSSPMVVKPPESSNAPAQMSSQETNESEENDEPNVGDAKAVTPSNAAEPTATATDATPQKTQEPPANQIPPHLLPYFNYFNAFNPNQYYQGNFNGGVKSPDAAPQYPAPNQPFQQFNPQYNPYNFHPQPPQPQPQPQPQPPPNYYNNPQLTPNQGALNSNRKKQKLKLRPNVNENQDTIASTTPKNVHNRRTRPTTNKKIKPPKEEPNGNLEVVNADHNFDSGE